jgi:hypothetical protein
MLTPARVGGWRWIPMALAALALVIGSTVWTPAPTADAASLCPPPQIPVQVPFEEGTFVIGIECQLPGGGGGGDVNCNPEAPYTFCLTNGQQCYQFDGHPPWPLPPGPKPSEAAQWKIRVCDENGVPVTRSIWREPRPSFQDWLLAGLFTPKFTVHAEPANSTYVGADTHFRVEIGQGEDPDQLESSPWYGYILVGKPKHVEITPGDGSPKFTCPAPWPTSVEDACVFKYQRTSADSTVVGPNGLPSFGARAVLVYDVHFEQIGVPGVPSDDLPLPPGSEILRSPAQTVNIPVGEIQALVE